MGLANALVWPTIWPLAIEGLGKYTAQGNALLIMRIAGGAIIPFIFCKAAHLGGDIQLAYLTGLPSYLFMLFYALKGHKINKLSNTNDRV